MRCCLIAVAQWLLVLTVSANAPESVSSRIETKLRRHLATVPSAAYAVTVDGEHLASGAVNRLGHRATDQTRFQIASLTMSFTASVILILDEEDKLSLRDDATRHLPEHPTLAGLKLHDLLIHRSGLLNYTEIRYPPDLVTPHQVLQHLLSQPGARSPATQYQYSNTNYLILGLVIERVTGKTFGQVLEERVFDPLGMNMSRYQPHPANLAIAFSAGGIESSARDMSRWLGAITRGEIDGNSVEKALHKQGPSRFGASEGYGWHINQSPLGQKIWHDGRTRGYRSAMALYNTPHGVIGVVLLTNSDRAEELPSLLDQIAQIASDSQRGGVAASSDELIEWIRHIQNGSVTQGPMTAEMRLVLRRRTDLLFQISKMGPIQAIVDTGLVTLPSGKIVQSFEVQFQSGETTHWTIGTLPDGTLCHLTVR